MNDSKKFRLLMTSSKEEGEVLAVLMYDPVPNLDGVLLPPSLMEHEGESYVLDRKWMANVYIYIPSPRRAIDDFLGNVSTQVKRT